MLKLAALALPFAILAMPATAQSLSDTHEMRWAPGGKLPYVHYHQKRNGCMQRANALHLSGKTPYVVAAADADCAKAVALTDTSKKTARD